MEKLKLLIDESIKYELDISKLYTLFSELIIQDSTFWKKLADEELNHANILRKSKSLFREKTEVINIISVDDINTIKVSRNIIKKITSDFKKNPTSKSAYEIAIKIETNIIESNYQKFMNVIPVNDIVKLFQMLNGEEKDHKIRIHAYFNSK